MRRLLTMLAATALLAGGAGAVPAQAAPDSGLPTFAGSTDRAGDADGRTAAGRAAADIRKVEYRAPQTPDGTMMFRLKFAKLQNGRKAGAPKQRAIVVLRKFTDPTRLWVVEADNRTGDVQVRTLADDEGRLRRITPESAQVKRTFKRGGVLVMKVSTEWLTAHRVRVQGYGVSGAAFDKSTSFRMNVSGRNGSGGVSVGISELADSAPSPAREANRYANCDALLRDWPNGVAQGPKAARKQVRDGNSRPASGKRARAVYQTNKGPLDRDKDGTACEN